VLLKAAAGGGGRGMRRCEGPREIDHAFAEATLEAEKAFGDGRLYLERWIDGGRHIEFQVLCDAFGSAIHLAERECSIQRKHQKLIEESPSPVLDDELRDSLGGRVARAVSELGYRNAGTVEFLRDADGNFYFMEMNTRLQVEHPVTEAITGIDLVQEQLRIAANQPLRYAQSQVSVRGHAMEFRINAEDPGNGFRPDPGTIRELGLPSADTPGVTVRWDSAVEAGYRIPPHYDSLIGKLIVHGPSRTTVLSGSREALERLQVKGVHTTVPVHLALLGETAFQEGNYDIDYLAGRVPGGSE
jgi:acetyl-CoA carboxylase biotin carboxylase subunit